ncbi:uncharacterized protein C19orf81 homolog isoform 2-T4 [Anomaloglossus baeobatrachus]|uniref:putative uncharacterized protein C19orf81 homolog isoform X2 n=1 Tax=Anomaloglossus baeobatrachus TaxID=238106 RepID=UPI003F4F6029
MKKKKKKRTKKTSMEDNKNKKTRSNWVIGDHNDLGRKVQKLHSEIALLTEDINHQNIGLPKMLKTKERHLKKIVHKYEELNPEKPLIGKFQNPPPPQPLTLCMETPPENDFRHRDILKAIEHIVPKAFEKKQVSKIQFENMNVIYGTAARENRWLITTSSFYIRDLLQHSGLEINGELFPLHCHDEVLIQDEKENLKRALTKNKILDTLINPTN